MKLLIATVAMFIGMSQAHAIYWPCGASDIDENSTWEEIDKSLAVIGAYPMHQINGHFISINGLCHDQETDSIVSKRAIEDCLERETNERGDCIKSAYNVKSTPRVTDSKTIPLDYMVTVKTNSSSTSCSADLFKKPYSLAKCQ